MKKRRTLTTEIEPSISQNYGHQVTDQSIDQILGLSNYDQNRTRNRFYFAEDRSSSHRHPYSSTPINQLGAFSLYIIIINYDKDRNGSKQEHYLQPGLNNSNINFLIDELSYAAMLILRREKNLPTQELGILATAIEDSQYLSSHPGMNEVCELATKMWLKLDDEPNQQHVLHDEAVKPS